MITKEQIQEVEAVVAAIKSTYHPVYFGSEDKLCYSLAILDRESVRNRCKVHYQLVKENMKSTLQRATVCSTISQEIQGLTNQINYLKDLTK